jgi:hypothetical protein
MSRNLHTTWVKLSLAVSERFRLTPERAAEQREADARVAAEGAAKEAHDVEKAEVDRAVDMEDDDGWYDAARM